MIVTKNDCLFQGIFKSGNPTKRANAMVQVTTIKIVILNLKL